MSENNNKHGRLTLYIFIGIVLAIFAAMFAPNLAMKTRIGGEIFLNLLKMIVVPLVMTSVLSGILGMGDVRKLGKPGAVAIGYYLTTTVLAVLIGIAVVNLVQPGRGTVDPDKVEEIRGVGVESPKGKMLRALSDLTDLSEKQVADIFRDLPQGENEAPSVWTVLENMVMMLFTDNLFQSALETQLLPLIFFCIIFGGMLTTLGERVDSFTELIHQANTALMQFVLLLMKIAPIGIFCLVAARFGKAQAEGAFVDELQQIGWYFGTVLLGLGFHALVTLPLIYWIVKRKNPYRFMYQMSQALLTAFSTASSSATLPVTMDCAIKRGGVSKRSVEFVLPLGATINMDGTALYEAVAAIFIAQVLGPAYDLTLMDQAVVAVTATLAAIGAAGIPEAGLITMLIVLNAVGLPVEYVSLILSVDWLLDRFRTAVNVFGDSVGAAVVEGTMAPEKEGDPDYAPDDAAEKTSENLTEERVSVPNESALPDGEVIGSEPASDNGEKSDSNRGPSDSDDSEDEQPV